METESPRTGEVLGDRYRVEERVGSGLEGEVFRATDLALGFTVALKVSRSSKLKVVRRLYDEARILSVLRHDAIVRLHESGKLPDGRAYLSLEWIAGCTLETYLSSGRLDEGQMLALGYRLASALVEIHEQRFLHRDLKPTNILLASRAPEGATIHRAKLVDFGVAGILGESVTRHGLQTRGNRWSGTPLYMAPEQLRGWRQTPATDIYLLGAVMYQSVYSHAPHCDGGELVSFKLQGAEKVFDLTIVPERLEAELALPSSPNLSTATQAVLLRMLRQDPEERFGNASELCEAIEGARQEVAG